MSLEKVQRAVEEARDIIDEIGESCPVYVSFDEDEYTLTKEQIRKIATALWLADLKLNPDPEPGMNDNLSPWDKVLTPLVLADLTYGEDASKFNGKKELLYEINDVSKRWHKFLTDNYDAPFPK